MKPLTHHLWLLALALALVACEGGSSSSGSEPDVQVSPDVLVLDLSLPEDVAVDAPAPGCESDEACAARLAAAGQPEGPCRSARCGADGQCGWDTLADGATCDDGDSCTEDTVCDRGACLGRYVCAACAATNECASLEDGNPCTGTLRCVEGRCETDPATVVACAAPADPCRRAGCDPATGECVEWPAADGSPCDDASVCTIEDACRDGLCQGRPLPCDDADACTLDTCDPLTGCLHTALVCDDGDACTADYCDHRAGCVFAPLSCDDGDLCTLDTCDPALGCQYAPRDCDDGDACTIDTCRPGTGCAHRALLCDDGDPATEDSCDPGTGQCVNYLASCDDADPCTVDSWDAAAGECRYWPLSCGDGDPCTDDRCDPALGCVHTPHDCDDGDPCTEDGCTPYVGCTYGPLSGLPCDDGRECSVDDTCRNGLCVGDDSACVCPAPAGPALKLVSLLVGTSGQPGQGLDVDSDPATCAPASNCSEGIDNAFSAVAGLANGELADAIEGGDAYILLQLEGFPTESGAFPLNGWLAEPADGACAHQSTPCAWWLDPRAFGEGCAPMARVQPGSLEDGWLRAGDPASRFTFSFPLLAGVDLEIVLYGARVEGQLTLDEQGQPAALTGVLAGAIRKDELRETILAVPPEEFPISVDIILNAVDLLLVADIDTDGDGVDDAVSAGLPLEGIAAEILGTLGE